MYRYLSEPNLSSLNSELAECSDGLDQDILPREAFGVSHGLDGGLIVSEDDTLPGGVLSLSILQVRSGTPAPSL